MKQFDWPATLMALAAVLAAFTPILAMVLKALGRIDAKVDSAAQERKTVARATDEKIEAAHQATISKMDALLQTASTPLGSVDGSQEIKPASEPRLGN